MLKSFANRKSANPWAHSTSANPRTSTKYYTTLSQIVLKVASLKSFYYFVKILIRALEHCMLYL